MPPKQHSGIEVASTAKQNDSINLYAAIMEEAKLRLNSIDMALGGATILPHQLVREFCFLQLRMLCELIALGCLTAHGDIEATTKLRNEWMRCDKCGQAPRTILSSKPERHARVCSKLLDALIMIEP
jgi:hypothetical protein